MTKIAVINYSNGYNLGAKKIEKYHRDQGDEVIYSHCANEWSLRCDKAYLSAIFTYDLPALCADALKLKSVGMEVEIGGPSPTAMPKYVDQTCGIKPHLGLDDRFEFVPGNFQMVFTSRGCRNHCSWCIAPKIEPESREYDNFPIPVGHNPWLGDNNLLGTSFEHQQLVVKKLNGVRNLDINSGFESPLFTEDHYQLYSKLDLESFRLAFDSMEVESDFTKAVKILKKHAVDYRRILVYVLIGFPRSTYEDDIYRLEKVRSLGCSPYPQRFQPLNSINSRNYVAPGWDQDKLETLRLYWVNPRFWRSCTFEEFKRATGRK
jgi:hypothetical protein